MKSTVKIALIFCTVSSSFAFAVPPDPSVPEAPKPDSWAGELTIKKSAIPEMIESALKKHSQKLAERLKQIETQKVQKEIGPISLGAGVERLEIDFENIHVKQIPQEQLIEEDAAIRAVYHQKGLATRTKEAALSAGQTLVSGICTVGKCIKDGLFFVGSYLGSDESELVASDEIQVPKLPPQDAQPTGKLKSHPEMQAGIQEVESLYLGRQQYLEHFKRIPQIQRAEYEVRIPIKEMSAAITIGLKSNPVNSEKVDLKLQGLDPTSDIQVPELVLRFSLAEDGHLLTLKLQGADGRLLSKISGGRVGIKGSPESSFLTQLHASYLDQISEVFSRNETWTQSLAKQFEYDTIRKLGDYVETSIAKVLKKRVQSATLDLGDVNELKAQHFSSTSATLLRLQEIQTVQNSIFKEIYELKRKADGDGPTGFNAYLSEKVRKSRVSRLDSLIDDYQKIVDRQVSLAKALPSKTTAASLEKMQKAAEMVQQEIELLCEHPQLKTKKKELLKESSSKIAGLIQSIQEVRDTLSPQVGQKKMRHELNLVVNDLDYLNFSIRAYIDKSADEIACSERESPFDEQALPPDNAAMRVTVGIPQMNDLLKKYHELGIFNLCNLVSVSRTWKDCFDNSSLGRLRVDFSSPPQIGFDSKRDKFYLSLGEARTYGSGIARILPQIIATRVYFSFNKCEQDGQTTLCITPETESEIANSWLETIRSRIIGFGIERRVKRKFGSKVIELPLEKASGLVSMVPTDVKTDSHGVSVYFNAK